MEFYSILEDLQTIINSSTAIIDQKIAASIKMQEVIEKILGATYLGTILIGNERQVIEEILSSGNELVEDLIKDTTTSGDLKRDAENYKELELRNKELAACLGFNIAKKSQQF